MSSIDVEDRKDGDFEPSRFLNDVIKDFREDVETIRLKFSLRFVVPYVQKRLTGEELYNTIRDLYRQVSNLIDDAIEVDEALVNECKAVKHIYAHFEATWITSRIPFIDEYYVKLVHQFGSYPEEAFFRWTLGRNGFDWDAWQDTKYKIIHRTVPDEQWFKLIEKTKGFYALLKDVEAEIPQFVARERARELRDKAQKENQ